MFFRSREQWDMYIYIGKCGWYFSFLLSIFFLREKNWKIEILRDEIYLFIFLSFFWSNFDRVFLCFFFYWYRKERANFRGEINQEIERNEGMNCFRSIKLAFRNFRIYLSKLMNHASTFEPAIKNSKTCKASENS